MKTFTNKLSLITLGFILISVQSFSEIVFWTNAGGDNLWSNDANWDIGIAPTSGDDVIFDGTISTDNCTIDAAASAGTLTFQEGYTGTISQNATKSLSVFSGDISFNSGVTFNQGAGVTVSGGNINILDGTWNQTTGSVVISIGDLNISGGTYNGGGTLNMFNFYMDAGAFNDGTGTVGIKRDFTVSGGTFTCNEGTFNFNTGSNSTRTQTITGTPTFYKLTFTLSTIGVNNDYTYVISDASTGITVDNLFTLSRTAASKYIIISTGKINAKGNVTVSGSSAAVLGGGTGTIVFNGTSDQTITGLTNATYQPLCNVEFAGSTRNITFGAGTQFLNIGGTFTMSGTGSLTLNTGTIIPRGNVTLTNTGTAGGGSATISFQHTSGSIDFTGTTEGNCRLPKVVFNCSGGTVALANTISIANDLTYTAGTITAGTSKISCYGTINLDTYGSSAISLYDLSIKSGTTTLTSNLDVDNDLTIDGTLSVGSYSITLGGDLTKNGTFTAPTTMTFDGTTVVGGSASHTFTNVVFSGTSLTFPNANVTVSGDWTNNGTTFTAGTGKVIFNGSNAQYGGSSNTTFNNVELSVSSSLTVPTAKTLTAAKFTVKSSSMSNTGNLIVQGTGAVTVTDSAVCERYLSYPGNKWHYISNPCASAAQGASFIGYYLRQYLSADPWWQSLTKTSAMPAGRGYIVKKADGTASTVKFKGAFNNGNIAYALVSTGDKWNIVGNPYPSTIDIDAAGAWGSTWSNIQGATMNFYNGTGYDTWQQGSPGSGTRPNGLIAPGEAGYVEAISGNWEVTNAARCTGNPTMYKKGEESKSTLTNLLRVYATDSVYTDQILVAFRDDAEAQNEMDTRWDARKMFGSTSVPQISSYPVADTLNSLVINTLGAFMDNITVNMDLTISKPGTMRLYAGNTESFDPTVSILLEDRKTNKVVDFRQADYTFSTDAVTNDKRFMLHFLPIITSVEKTDMTGSSNSPYAMYCVNNQLYIHSKNNTAIQGDLVIYDLAGREIMKEKINTSEVSKIQMNLQGVFISKLTTVDGVYAQKVYMK